MIAKSGLYGHIQRNTAKSAVLLAAFFGLAWGLWFSLHVFYQAVFWRNPAGTSFDLTSRFKSVLADAWWQALATWWIPIAAALVWAAGCLLFCGALIRLATGARPVTRREQPRLYTMVENLSVTAGLPMPRIEIMPSPQLNAYAAGFGPSDAVIAVTRGLLDDLEDDELEAVLAHEMGHILNRDIRLLVVANALASALAILFAALRSRRVDGEWRNDDTGFLIPASLFVGAIFLVTSILPAVLFVVVIALFALMVKFALSRSREFLADAAAVELTRNPDALIAALMKISGRDQVPVTSPTVQAMMISFDGGDLFATHPPIDDRIAALRKHAGGRLRPRRWKNGLRRFGTWTRRGYSGLRNGRSSPIRG